jgi:hypothetical protein
MKKPNIKYDEISDTLTISFESNVLATGVELTEHILLRLNKSDRTAVSLAFFDYSVIAQTTDVGIHHFPLTGLSKLSDELRDIVIEILQSKPVSQYIYLSAYTPSITEIIPIISLQAIPVLSNVA